MSDDERRLIIDEPDSPDNDRLVIASEDEVSDTELGRFLMEDTDIVIIDEISPAKNVNGSSSKKEKHQDPDVTPPYINGSVMDKNEESIEDGEIADDDVVTVDDGMDQRTTNQHPSYRNSSHKSPTRSNRDSRDSRDGRDEKREGRSNGSIGDSHSSRSGSSHAHSAASAAAAPPTSSHPQSRGAPGGVRSKPNPLSAPQTLSPAGHLRKSVDREKERKDRHKSIHSLHSCISSSTASGGSSSTPPVVSTPLPPPPPPPPPPSSIPSLPSSMALDVPPAVPSPAITDMMEKGEKKRETKENGERRERNGSVSSSTSSVKEGREMKEDMTSSIEEKKKENGRKREERSEKNDGEQPPEKKRKHKEERREKMETNVNRETDEERTNNNPSPPMMYSRGTSVDVQTDRDDSILNLPAGSSLTLTFTIAATVGSGEPDGGLNTMYISAMIGGREWMGCIRDGDEGRRRSVVSSASSEDGRKAFRGNGTTARDKRARNGLERKRRNQVDNDEEDGNSHDSTSTGEGTSTGQRITLVENGNKREMHHCVIDNCDFRFSSKREMEYHKWEMHNKKKVMKEDLASQTDFISPFLTPHFSIECQTDDVVVRTKEEIEEEKKMRIKEKEEDEKKWKEEEERRKKETTVKTERPPTPVETKPNGVLTIQTGTRPSVPTASSSGAAAPEGTLLMKASPISTPIAAAAPATPTAAAARGAETAGGTHKIHAPIAMAPSITSSSSSSMPTLTPAVSTPSTPTTSKPPRVAGGSGGGGGGPSVPSPRTLPLVPPQLPPGLFPNGLPNAASVVGSPAQAQAMQMQQMHQMMQQQQQMAMMQQHAAAQQQQKAAAASNTQHKINELKAKDDCGPSTSSGIAPHPSMPRPTVAPSMPVPTPQTPQRPPQMQQQPQFPPGFAMMPMMNPAQQAAAQQVMQQEFMRQMYLSTLMNQNGQSAQQQQQQAQQQQQQQMQPNFMQPSQSQMMMMQQLMMHAQQQQPK